MTPPGAPVVLKVEHLNAGKMVQDVSFELHKGEILGFSGLMGAGRTETARALFGADTTAVIFISTVRRLQSRAHRMLLSAVSVICQRTERDMVLLYRNQLLRIQQWQHLKNS